MNPTARQLREQRFKLVQDAQALVKDGFTPELRVKWDKMMADADALKADIDRLERADALETELRGSAPPSGQIVDPNNLKAEERQKKEAAAFRAFLLRGNRLSDEERSLLREQTDFRVDGLITGGGNALQGTGGGYFVPVGFVDRVESALKYYGPMLTGGPGNPTIMETATGQPLPYPTDNDTTVVGELLSEGSPADLTSSVSLGAVIFNAYQFSTRMVKVSRQMLQDSAFNVETFLEDKFALRIGRILNTYFTTGTGGGTQPNGIVTAATAGPAAAGSATNDGLSLGPQASIGSDDLIDLEHSIDILYRRGAKYMMHDTTLKLLKTLKDKYGRPLWIPGLAVNAPDTINGYGYLVNNDMDQLPITGPNSPVTTKKTILFGALSKYLIRRVKDLAVLRLEERFAEYGQVAFLGFARYDGNLLDAGTHPVKYLTNSY